MILGAAMALTACKKYEEGPLIQLTPRDERVANTWEFESAYEDGEDVSDDFDQYELYLASDGDAELTAEYTFLGVDYVTETDGTWSFENNDENLLLNFEDDSQDNEYQILRLTNDELWLRELGNDLELHLREK